MRMPAVLQGRDFRRLLYGQATSSFGDWMATVALMALALDLTGSATAVGGILALRLLPSVLAGPVSAGVASRWDRRRTMLAMDIVRAVLVVLIPLVPALWWVYTLAFLTELANLVFLPARDSAVPDLVPDPELPTANGLILVSSYGNIPLGAAAFAAVTSVGGIVGRHPYLVVFTLDAVTYLVSFACIRTIAITDAPDEGLGDATPVGAFVRAFRLPLVRAVLPGLSTVMLGAGALFSLGILYVTDVLGAGQRQFGLLIALFGVGAAGAVAWVQQREGGVTVQLIRGGVATMGIVLMVMSVLSNLWLAYGMAVLFGAAASTALVGGISYLQHHLAGRHRVLGFTAFHVILRFGMAIAAIVAGIAVDRVGPARWPLVGNVSPTSQVMFAAGVFVALGAALIHEPVIGAATTDRSTR